ncbi:hypothetical protein ACFVYA_40185 [Amycolatopsis sp. NPDC058278]|uniref:hypothetical protein n=1 Tax=Amycolatopsis sp. NPDC058278 TaxID=3346417 RepID=UPI0036DCA6F0
MRRDVAALATAGLGVAELHAAAIELVDRVVPAELTCWASLDPDTAVISSMTSGRARIPGEYEPLLATYEYDGAQPHTFAELALLLAGVPGGGAPGLGRSPGCHGGQCRWRACRTCPAGPPSAAAGSPRFGGRWGSATSCASCSGSTARRGARPAWCGAVSSATARSSS